jgi:hypothetical protein
MLSELLRVNRSITYINMSISTTDTATSIHLIDTLRINNILETVIIPLNIDDFSVCEYLADFLLENHEPLIKISIFCFGYKTVHVTGIDLIFDALKNNNTIEFFESYFQGWYDLETELLEQYGERNKHNTKLRNLSILDIC